MKVKSVGRLSKPFEGTDAIAEWHKNRTKSSMAEAFKGADYAIAIEAPQSEWRDFWEFVGGLVLISPFIFVGLYVVYLVLKGMGAL
jgi:hypothetical protein